MRFVFFTHSLISCWNHGNAHFLRGVMRELQNRGHEVRAFEPVDGWSRQNLLAECGEAAHDAFQETFPSLSSSGYDLGDLGFEDWLGETLEGADAVVVHEWNEPALVQAVGRLRAAGGKFLLFFHDTHHRAMTRPDEMARFDLRHYDAALCYGASLAGLYRERGWAARTLVWHEAADEALFRPLEREKRGDLVWIGNWGDGERTAELREFLLEPARDLRLRAEVWGVRYPPEARAALAEAGLAYRGWLPNHRVPEVFAEHRVTVHVPRRPYASDLPGIPTIRVFEALACGIPLVCSPWDDAEGLFRPGRDYLVAEDGAAMRGLLRKVLLDRDLAGSLARSGLETIRSRHTCAHRVEDLLAYCRELRGELRRDAREKAAVGRGRQAEPRRKASADPQPLPQADAKPSKTARRGRLPVEGDPDDAGERTNNATRRT